MKKTSIQQGARKFASLILVAVLAMGMMVGLTIPSHAVDLPDINYDYSADVQTGTIRYLSQNDGKTNNSPRSGFFDDRYWGDYWLQPHYELDCSGPGFECGTASISMALSYVGINKTPQDILDANHGQTIFDGWGADLQAPGLSDAMDRFSGGDGKYSPVMIHFKNGAPGYPYGHYVLAIGKSGDTYSILDPNRDTVWTLSTGDALFGYIDQVYQYYNKNAAITPKMTLPDQVKPTNVQLKAAGKDGAILRSGPGKTFPVVKQLKKGAVVTAVGYTTNQFDHLWYYLDDGTYVYAENTVIDKYLSSAKLTGHTAPSGKLTYGNIFILQGSVSGDDVYRVQVNIKNASGEVILSSSDSVCGAYTLQGSSIDQAMTFNTLPRGDYRYELIVAEDLDSGSQCINKETLLCSSDFSVV